MSSPNDTTLTQAVDTTLNSSDSTIHVVCVYVNGSLDQCGVTPTAGTLVSDRNCTSMEEAAARILLAHQQQTGRDSTALLNTLNLVNITQATPVTSDNVSFTITHFPDLVGSQIINGIPVPVASNSSFSTTFRWSFPDCSVTMTFDHGVFCGLQDCASTEPRIRFRQQPESSSYGVSYIDCHPTDKQTAKQHSITAAYGCWGCIRGSVNSAANL